MQSEKLKTCPFCGHAPVFRQIPNDGRWELGCHTINCIRPKCVESRDKGHLISAWNRRASTQSTNSDLADERGNAPPFSGEPWIERWCGSGMLKGSSIWTVDNLGCHKNMIEHFGGDEETHASVRRIVAAHNAALRSTPDARAEALRQAAQYLEDQAAKTEANLEHCRAGNARRYIERRIDQRREDARAILALLSQEPTP